MNKAVKRAVAIAAGLSICVMSSISALADGVDGTECPLCKSETTVYTVGGGGPSEGPETDCIHHAYGTDRFVTYYELRCYSCCDCGCEWDDFVEAGWYWDCHGYD